MIIVKHKKKYTILKYTSHQTNIQRSYNNKKNKRQTCERAEKASSVGTKKV